MVLGGVLDRSLAQLVHVALKLRPKVRRRVVAGAMGREIVGARGRGVAGGRYRYL